MRHIKTDSASALEGYPAKHEDQAEINGLEITDNTSRVVLAVGGMSCSGCISTIKSALSEFKGIREILVDIASGKATVYYDKTQLKDVQSIAGAINDSGYPAEVLKVFTADQIRRERKTAGEKSRVYIAGVGDFEISRVDFENELEHAKNRYAFIYGRGVFDGNKGKTLVDNLKGQIVTRLINEGIQLQEIKKAGYTIDAKTVEAEFANFLSRQNLDERKFSSELKENGYEMDYFRKRFETRVLIDKYLEEKIVPGVSNEYEKQRRYSYWFNNARLLAKVVYYDKDLERLVRKNSSGSGCSGGTCSVKN